MRISVLPSSRISSKTDIQIIPDTANTSIVRIKSSIPLRQLLQRLSRRNFSSSKPKLKISPIERENPNLCIKDLRISQLHRLSKQLWIMAYPLKILSQNSLGFRVVITDSKSNYLEIRIIIIQISIKVSNNISSANQETALLCAYNSEN